MDDNPTPITRPSTSTSTPDRRLSCAHDADIRHALCAWLRERHPGSVLMEELGIRKGAARVDVVLVHDSLAGFEIKSATDTLRRLPMQVQVYGEVLDVAALVVAHDHLEASIAIIEPWWTVIVAREVDDGTIVLETLRAGTANPHVNKRALAELIWRDDAMTLLHAKGAARGLSGKPRSFVWDRVAECCTLDEVRAHVRMRLRDRSAVGR